MNGTEPPALNEQLQLGKSDEERTWNLESGGSALLTIISIAHYY